MGKPSASILSRDESQSLGNGLLERFSRASSYAPQNGFQFGEGLLNGREIGRIRRQKQKTTSSGFNGLSHAGSLVNAQIIQNDDLPRLQTGGEHLLNVDLKGSGI